MRWAMVVSQPIQVLNASQILVITMKEQSIHNNFTNHTNYVIVSVTRVDWK